MFFCCSTGQGLGAELCFRVSVSKQRLSGNSRLRVRQVGRVWRERQRETETDGSRNMDWRAVGKRQSRRAQKVTLSHNVALLMSIQKHPHSLSMHPSSVSYILFATLFTPSHAYLILKKRGQGHQQGDDVLQQAERILLISKQEGGQSTIRCKSLRVTAFLRKLGSPSCPQYDNCMRKNRIESFWSLVLVICVIISQ